MERRNAKFQVVLFRAIQDASQIAADDKISANKQREPPYHHYCTREDDQCSPNEDGRITQDQRGNRQILKQSQRQQKFRDQNQSKQ